MLVAGNTFDAVLFPLINQEWTHPWLDPAMEAFSTVPLLWAVMVVTVAVLIRRCWRGAGPAAEKKRTARGIVAGCLIMACSVFVTESVTYAIKFFSARLRPYQELAGTRHLNKGQWVTRPAGKPAASNHGNSFVSGHASNSMALAASLGYFCPPLKPFVYVLPLCVGYSRVYLGRHYPTDVLAGCLLGWLLSSCVCRAFGGWRARTRAQNRIAARSRQMPAGSPMEKRIMEPQTDLVCLIIPVYNEEANLPLLFAEILGAMGMQRRPWQALFVNDGSTDGSLGILRNLANTDTHARYISFERNCGQSAAFDAGFRHAPGAVFVTLDADLQNDPRDIPRMLDIYDEGYDMVIGWRKKRQDSLAKRWASRFANKVRNCISRESVKDTGCSLKVLNADMARRLSMYTGMHRFLPTLMKMHGATVAEVMVNHRAREYGQSKYGIWDRAFSSLYDLFAVRWMQKRHFSYHITETR